MSAKTDERASTLGDRLAREASPEAVNRPLLRAALVVLFVASLAVTWPLWTIRSTPLPNLPLVPLPPLDIGWVLVIALVLVPVAPRVFTAVTTVVVLFALAADQARIQPWVVSLTLLLWATLPFRTALLLGRTHLASLWLFAGIHKLLSPEFLTSWGRGTQDSLLGDALPVSILALVVGATEVLVGVLVFVARTRSRGAIAAAVLHCAIVVVLLVRDVNSAVWPWNVALVLAAPALLLRWRQPVTTLLRTIPVPARVAAVVLYLLPLGFYVGAVDAYVAHCLYSRNTPRATFRGERVMGLAMRTFNAPLPPERRLFEQLFEAVAEPGDRMEITDPRPFAEERDVLLER